MSKPNIPLALYLWKRIRQLGVESVQGVPGDFNLNFLDYIYEVPGLKFIGNSNELNAAYAADGYAKVKGVPGCLVTTHGVGELSAINGIAGAAAEHLPIIHVVGQTPRAAQENRLMIHHSIGSQPDHQLYNKISKPLGCSTAGLWDPEKAPAEIDRAILECLTHRLPIYMFFPIDLSPYPVSPEPLSQPLGSTLPINHDNETAAVQDIIAALMRSHNPSVLVDHLVWSYALPQTRALVEKLRLPTYTSHMGKGAVDEDKEYFVGVYNAQVSCEGVQEAFEGSDLMLSIGTWRTDSNTAFFSRNMPVDKVMDVQVAYTTVKHAKYENVFIAPLLERLLREIDMSKIPLVPMPKVGGPPKSNDKYPPEQITQVWLWPKIERFLRQGDVILADTGTASFAVPDIKFPGDVIYTAQTYWGSIGHATGSATGAALAVQELQNQRKSAHQNEHSHLASSSVTAPPQSNGSGRVVLITGDGSLQLVIQEIGTMIRWGLKVIIIIINNDGYTIERAIHGARQPYNDINPVDFSHLLPLFRHPKAASAFRRAVTKSELEKALEDESLANSDSVEILEIVMDKFDIPWRLARILEMRNGDALRKEGFSNTSA